MEQKVFAVRSLTRPDELLDVIELQRLIHMDDDRPSMQYYTLIDTVRNGGQILGAFDDKLLVGYLVSSPGLDSLDPYRPAMANLKFVLDRMAVHPDYRGAGIANRMVLRLREMMDKISVRLVTGVINPMDSRMAAMSIGKLGSIARYYVPDYYGMRDMDGDIAGSTDRFIIEWWITGKRVEERLGGNRPRLTLRQYLEAETPILNPTTQENDLPIPFNDAIEVPTGRQIFLIEVPADLAALQRLDPELMLDWKQHVRDGLSVSTQASYVATDFLYEEYEGRMRAFYLMTLDGPGSALQM